jgi:FkbM family methyltransferase
MRITETSAAVTRFGVSGTLKLLASRRRLRRVLPSWTRRVRLRDYPFPFHFRHATTDKYVIVEVLLREQYDCLRGQPNVRTIVDVGANIGTASVFLLNAYPDASVIAIEADRGNFEVLQRNLAPYGPRARALHLALWHRSEMLMLDRGSFRDGGEWSFQVKSACNSAAEVRGVTLPQLMAEQELSSINILKVDIEGAERYVFDRTLSRCLPRIDTLAIELHDPECRDVFFRATAGVAGDCDRHGEVTVWRRR